ncbi:SMC-Scp complex subunit ScpB [Brevibacterium oceani]|uniref:SMC-Scp complex subunit ScpB n=1 Tax=Brevibacterium oceani TaxID=358099 RepID=UPI001B32FFED|nr:SMC-Scp complex subunit ScpB [Brevibacterium oceani]
MIDDEVLAGIEAVLMITDSAVTADELATSLGLDEDTVLEAIAALKADYDGDETHRQRGFEIRHVAGGFRIFSRGDYHEVVKDFLTSGQSAKLSQAALETLAVIAYRQPISRPRIAAIRGVSVDGVIRTLLLRGLIVEAGKEASTSALLYATTPQFLDTMGMNSIDDLPDIAPYLPEDADVAELGAEDTEVLAEIDGDLDEDDDLPAIPHAQATGAAEDTGDDIADERTEMSRVDV